MNQPSIGLKETPPCFIRTLNRKRAILFIGAIMAKLPNNYFPHDFNARIDRKILRLRKVLGIEGYGIFWMLIETLCTEENFSYPISDIDLLADDYGCSVEKVEAVVKQFGLFQIDEGNNFFSLSLITRLQKYLDISEKARLNVTKRWEKARKMKGIDTPVLPPYCESTTIKEKERKGKDIIEKNIIENERKEYFEMQFIQKISDEHLPIWREWIDYCYARGDVKLNRQTVVYMINLLKEHSGRINEIIITTMQKNAKGLIANGNNTKEIKPRGSIDWDKYANEREQSKPRSSGVVPGIPDE